MPQPFKQSRTVLIAEDDAEVRGFVETALRYDGYAIETADNGDEALEILRSNPHISAVLLDIMMPRRDGLETLKEIRRTDPTIPVIMVSAASSPFNIVEAMKNGANDFLGKPVTHSDLWKVLRTALNSAPAPQPKPVPDPAIASNVSIFFGQNHDMAEIRSVLPKVGWSEAPALIMGETGAGKEVLARELHARSPRAQKPFLKVNCAALPSELVESELFGYEKGAFTGAFQKKPGMFEMADGGTIFLDEIGDMDFKLQAKLLQVLQDSEFSRLGGKEMVRVDVRVIAATHKDLDRAIAENTFREDLYYRLNVISLRLPPLRERKEDLPRLTEFLIHKHIKAGEEIPTVTPEMQAVFTAYDWPGNIRELENVVRKLLILRDPDMVVREIQARMRTDRRKRSAEDTVTYRPDHDDHPILEQVTRAKNEAERKAIMVALESTQWNRKKAAVVLKIDYKALLYKMKKLGIDDRMAALPDIPDHVGPPQHAGR
jgi:two-component system response regulator AtoC